MPSSRIDSERASSAHFYHYGAVSTETKTKDNRVAAIRIGEKGTSRRRNGISCQQSGQNKMEFHAATAHPARAAGRLRYAKRCRYD